MAKNFHFIEDLIYIWKRRNLKKKSAIDKINNKVKIEFLSDIRESYKQLEKEKQEKNISI